MEKGFKPICQDMLVCLQVCAIVKIERLYYDDGVNELIPFSDLLTDEPRGYFLLIAPHAAADALLRLTAHLALRGRVNILDAALGFDVHRVARLLRQQSTAVYAALEQVQLVRVFNACQLVDGLRAFEHDTAPILILGALALFETDLLSGQRERHLLVSYFALLRQLGRERAVFAGVKPDARLTQAPWNELMNNALRVYDLTPLEEASGARQLDLFGGIHG